MTVWIVTDGLGKFDYIRNGYNDILYFTELEDAKRCSPNGTAIRLVKFDRRTLPKEKKHDK